MAQMPFVLVKKRVEQINVFRLVNRSFTIEDIAFPSWSYVVFKTGDNVSSALQFESGSTL